MINEILCRIGRTLARVSMSDTEPANCTHGGVDWLPPVLGPADWSNGLIVGMADSSNAWYFDRR